MGLANWKTQLRKGLLDLCVLNFLASQEYYGYDLVQELKKLPALSIREGTVYPILARLEEEGLVVSQVRPSDSGPPRKYFNITSQGRRTVREMNEHWGHIEGAVRSFRWNPPGGEK